jgi:MFS superfamily sulfate permease-like transporter
VLFRWDAPLFFANAEIFAEHVNRAVQQSPTPARWVVVAAEPVTDIDTTAADVLHELLVDLAADRIRFAFAELKGPVKDQLEQYGLLSEIEQRYIFRTVGSAVHAYVAESGVDWVDWEDQKQLV